MQTLEVVSSGEDNGILVGIGSTQMRYKMCSRAQKIVVSKRSEVFRAPFNPQIPMPKNAERCSGHNCTKNALIIKKCSLNEAKFTTSGRYYTIV